METEVEMGQDPRGPHLQAPTVRLGLSQTLGGGPAGRKGAACCSVVPSTVRRQEVRLGDPERQDLSPQLPFCQLEVCELPALTSSFSLCPFMTTENKTDAGSMDHVSGHGDDGATAIPAPFLMCRSHRHGSERHRLVTKAWNVMKEVCRAVPEEEVR